MTKKEPLVRTVPSGVPQPLRSRWQRWSSDPALLSAVAVLASGMLLAEANVLSALSYRRWDLSDSQRFTLSEQTRNLLSTLDDKVQITLLLSSGSPLEVDVRHTLDAFHAETDKVTTVAVDPDRDAAEFIALSAQHPVLLGRDEQGAPQASIALLLERQGRHHYVSRTDLATTEVDGTRALHIERALSEGILALAQTQQKKLCLTTGHGEKSPDDLGPEGLMELVRRVQVTNIEPVRVSLDTNRSAAELNSCDLVAVVGPKLPIVGEAQRQLLALSQQGADFLLLLDPIINSAGNLSDASLQELTESFGIHQRGGFVLETDESRRLPQGIGEAFVAQPEPHPVTSTLQTDDYRNEQHFVVSASQPLTLSGTAVPLLTSSRRAAHLGDLREAGRTEPAADLQQLVIAAASSKPGSHDESKMIVFGSSGFAESSRLSDPAFMGSSNVLLSAIAWLTERLQLLGINEDAASIPSLPLTEESLSSLLNYVLIYMPSASALLGLFVFLRRRRGEQLSRQQPSEARP